MAPSEQAKLRSIQFKGVIFLSPPLGCQKIEQRNQRDNLVHFDTVLNLIYCCYVIIN